MRENQQTDCDMNISHVVLLFRPDKSTVDAANFIGGKSASPGNFASSSANSDSTSELSHQHLINPLESG